MITLSWRDFGRGLGVAALIAAAAGCGGSDQANIASGCPALSSGTPWVPNVSGVAATNHDATVTTTSTTLTPVTGPVTGYAQAAPAANELTVPFTVANDVGPNGSISLVATVSNFPSSVLTQGSAYPVLVYLSDGTHDFINFARAGTGGDCAAAGYFSQCTTNGCSPNAACAVNWPSAYTSFAHWEDRNISNFGYMSVNIFPTCNWTQGVSPPQNGNESCAFTSTFFPATPTPIRLRTGSYTAKYVLLASNYSKSVPSSATATLNVTLVTKQTVNTTPAGAIDLNVVLVGTQNVNDSRTAKGQQNLNTLLAGVQGYYAQSGTNVKIGQINAIEWPCQGQSGGGGDAYANISTGNTGTMLQNATSLLSASEQGKALNIFLISSFSDNSAVLGLSAAIGGPMINGTPSSGLTFASFNKLGSFNPNCSAGSATCPVTQQEAEFFDMSSTIAHEMGHFLGLNHPSEADGAEHDMVYDTPICTALDSSSGTTSIKSCFQNDTNIYNPTGKTCSQACLGYDTVNGVYCPTVLECPFNHIMWRTSKHFTTGTATGDGNIFSTQTGTIINYNPFVQ